MGTWTGHTDRKNLCFPCCSGAGPQGVWHPVHWLSFPPHRPRAAREACTWASRLLLCPVHAPGLRAAPLRAPQAHSYWRWTGCREGSGALEVLSVQPLLPDDRMPPWLFRNCFHVPKNRLSEEPAFSSSVQRASLHSRYRRQTAGAGTMAEGCRRGHCSDGRPSPWPLRGAQEGTLVTVSYYWLLLVRFKLIPLGPPSLYLSLIFKLSNLRPSTGMARGSPLQHSPTPLSALNILDPHTSKV